jgi:hypothetical protein
MGVYAGPDVSESGLVLAFDAGNAKSYPGSGTTWTDLSGRGNSGTLINGPTYSSSNGGTINLDGINDYIDGYNDSTIFANDNSLTVSIFANIAEASKDIPGGLVCSQRYQSEGDPGGYGFVIPGTTYGSSTTLSVNLTKNISGTSTSYQNLSQFTYVRNQFRYYSFTYSSSSKTVSTYMNGILQNSSTDLNYGWTVNTSSRKTLIGQNTQGGWSNQFYNIRIGAVHIHNRALTAAEIQQNFNATKSRYGL